MQRGYACDPMRGEDKIALPVDALQHADKSSKVEARAQNGPDA